MVLASGTQANLSYVEEVTRGVTPGTPSMLTLRTTSRNINWERDSLETDEVRASALVSDVRHGFGRVTGSPGYELSLAAYDDFIQYAVRGTWAAKSVTVLGSVTFGTSTITRGSGSWATDSVQPGDIITIAGSTSNDGTYRVKTRDSTTQISITADSTLTAGTDASGVTYTFPGKFVQSGTIIKTVSIERRLADIGQYQVFKGVAVNEMSMSIRPGGLVNGSFGLLGLNATAATGTSLGTPAAAPTNSPMSSFVGNAFLGGTKNAILTTLDFTVANNYQTEGVFGSTSSPDIFLGTQRVTGTATVFIDDATNLDRLNDFFNETESSIWTKIFDPNLSDFIDIKFPRAKFTAATIDPPQQGPISLVLPFTALEDTSSGGTSASIIFQRSNV